MRVAIVTETHQPDAGGRSWVLGRLGSGLAGLGHDVRVWSGGAGRGVYEERVGGCRVSRMGMNPWGRLVGAWREERPEVVYIAMAGWRGMGAVAAARWLRIPFGMEYREGFRERAARCGLGWLGRPAERVQQWVHGLGAFTVVASRGEVETLEKGGYDRVVRVGSGVDCDWFHPDHRDEALRRTWGVSPWHTVVLMGGRVVRERNLPLALEAVKGLQSRGVRVQAVVAGEGPFLEECRERWPWAVYTGGIDRRRLAVTAASCDLLALPSMTETSGREVLEGMASGLPVVAFDSGVVREHVVHGVNGWVETPWSDAGYARLLGRVVQMSEEQRLPVCRGARRTALGLTWEVVVGRFEAVLRRGAAGEWPEGAIPPTVPSPSAS